MEQAKGLETKTHAEGSNASAPHKPAGRAWSRAGLLIVLLALLVQMLAARQSFLRDVEFTFPLNFDQIQYLKQVYDAYETVRNNGLAAGLGQAWFAGGRPQGVLLQGEALLLCTLFGANRITCLAVVFAHFALLQLVLYFAFRKITGHAAYGLIAIGLLLLTISRYLYAGGLNDFRLDLAASCLYGCTLCALLASRFFEDGKWTLLFIVFCGALIATRFISVTYTLIAAGATIMVVFAAERMGRLQGFGARRWKLAIASMMAAPLLAAPFMLGNLSGLYQYYFVGHLMSAEKHVRAAEQNVDSLETALRFYPGSLSFNHLGTTFYIAVLILFMVFGVAALGGRASSARKVEASAYPVWMGLVATAIWILVPTALFTYDESKSPVVASTMVAPVILFIVLCLYWLQRRSGEQEGLHWHAAVAALVLFTGTAFAVSRQTLKDVQLEGAKAARDLYAAVDEIAGIARRNPGRVYAFASDRLASHFNAKSMQIMVYERAGIAFNAEEWLATTIMSVPKEYAFSAIDRADFAMISVSQPSLDNNPKLHLISPFNYTMTGLRTELRGRAESQMVPIRRAIVADHTFDIFARIPVSLSGESGGWLTADGTTLQIPRAGLRRWKYLLVSGPTMLSKELKQGLQCRASLQGSSGEEHIPSLSFIGNDVYFIALDLSAVPDGPGDSVEAALRFPTYFVPKERGINPDERKLVVRTPQIIRFLQGPAQYPKELQAAEAARPGQPTSR